LIVNFDYLGKTYQGEVLLKQSKDLENNNYLIAVKPPKEIILEESEISVIRQQKEKVPFVPILTDLLNSKLVQYESERSIKIDPSDSNLVLAVQVWKDSLTAINPDKWNDIQGNESLTSRDLIAATDIEVGTGGLSIPDRPREVAVTNNGNRAYVTLENSHSIAVVDTLMLRQVDINPETEEMDMIVLPPGAAPRELVISPDNNFVYIADRAIGSVYVVDINPSSETFHELVETINLPGDKLRKLAISADGKKLFVTSPLSKTPGKGSIYVINIDPLDRPQDEAKPNTRKWHQVIGTIEAESRTEGIAATPEVDKMVFTNGGNDAKGFGLLTITDNDPTNFKAETSYINVGIGSVFDYFDVNDARSVVVTNDGKYGFVGGFNGRNLAVGVESISDPLAGSNIGIIKDQLTENAKLVAATRPIPMGLTTDLVLNGGNTNGREYIEDKFLYAAYPGVGSVFGFDVEKIIDTIAAVEKTVSESDKYIPELDLTRIPIDEINPDIIVAGDLKPLKTNRDGTQFGTPPNSNRPPLGIGSNPWGLGSVSKVDWLDLVSPGDVTEDNTPTFEWKFDPGYEDVKEVNLFVSSFDVGEGLLPWDEIVDLSDNSSFSLLDWFFSLFTREEAKEIAIKRWNDYDDFNPGRILTATWKKDTNKWYRHDGTEILPGDDSENTKTSLTLNDILTLTAGQDYNWAVEATRVSGETQIDLGSFRVEPKPTQNPFTSVSVITHGFTLRPSETGIDKAIYQLADGIVSASGEDLDEKGLMLLYNKPTGLWVPVDEKGRRIKELTNNLKPGDKNYLTTLAANIKQKYSNQNKSLVLLPEWSTKGESTIDTSGFTEGAADAIFASMVQLDQALGGDVGEKDSSGKLVRLYDDEGDLIRKHGDIFNSALHFIGFSRGTVVTSEIIQRLGTYFPYAGGPINADGTPVTRNGKQVRNLQMTTIDPHDFFQESLKINLLLPGTTIRDYRDFDEPRVEVWENVTFADNYYQTVANPEGSTFTPNGRFVEGADVNVKLNGRAGFTSDNGRGGPHSNAFAWYAGTVDFDLDKVNNVYTEGQKPIYDRLGKLISLELDNLLNKEDKADKETGLVPWYSSSNSKGSSEGIGNGWYYSAIAGGKRPDVDLTQRKLLSYDNTDDDIVSGDFAVPTVFNGSFDVGVSDDPNAPVPGWSFHNGENEQPLLMKHLVDVSTLSNELDTQNLKAPLTAALDANDRVRDRAVRLQVGRRTNAIHNITKVPDWGDLRFDLRAPVKAGKLIISLTANKIISLNGRSITEPLKYTKEIDLSEDAIGRLNTYESDIYKIGSGRQGFETFHIDSKELEAFRGLTASLKFEIVGETGVYLNNVYFKTINLQFGNPTEARYTSQPPNFNENPYFNNLLIEKPQYAASYGSDINTPVWVSWQVNQNWSPTRDRVKRPNQTEFLADPELPEKWKKIDSSFYEYLDPEDNKYKSYGFNQGHLIPSADRVNTKKDNRATFLGTNLIPQSADNNEFFGQGITKTSAWLNIENFERALVDQGRELYIVAGVYGGNPQPQKKSNANPGKYSGNTKSAAFVQNGINIPTWTWKTILVLNEAGQEPEDVTANTVTYTFLTPNRAEPHANWTSNTRPVTHPFNEIQDKLNLSNPPSQIQNATEWRNPSTWQITINQLQDLLNGWGGRTYNFFSNVPNNVGSQIKDRIHAYSPTQVSSPLLSGVELSPNSIPITSRFDDNFSIWHSGIAEESTPKQTVVIPVSSSQISPSKINSFHISKKQIGSSQVGITKVGTTENGSMQIGSSQISSSNVGTAQTGTFQVGSTQISVNQVSRIFEFLGNLMIVQNDSTQILTPQIGTMQNDTREHSFSRSVTSEEFLSTNYTTGVVFDAAIRHDSLTKQGIFRFNPSQISPIQISSSQNSSIQIGSSQISPSQISSSQISPSQLNSSQVGMSQVSTNQPSATQTSLSQIGVPQIGISQITMPQINKGQVSSTQVNVNQISFLQGSTPNQINSTEIPFSSSIPFQQLLTSHNLPLEITNTLQDNPLNISLEITDLPTGQLAEAQVTEYTDQGIPNGGKILIDHNANGLGWFIDTTPFDHSEFSHTLTDTALLAAADSEAYGKYDLLTAILHEMGHLAGFISGYTEFDRHIQTINGKKTFVGDNFTATLAPGGSHLDSKAHPHDLMNTTLRPGVRKLPSLLNLQILNYLRSEGVSEGESEGEIEEILTAPLTSTPLLGINNGTFDTQEIWSTRGAANIIEGQAVLTEESRLNSNFTQDFIIPSEAKYLQFTILESDLEGRRKEEEGRNNNSTSSLFPLPSSLSNAPGDAFEVALLNTNPLTPLAGITNEFSQTDALLNIQHDGDSYFSDKVKLSGAETSGDSINLNSPRTVTVDIRDIAPNTEATLYFDLLGCPG
ncbi:MAG: DNA/RNA non-specific endonuclease, partial [Bacteroidota bacterium]